MKNLYRIFVTIGVGLLVALMLAACGGDQPANSPVGVVQAYIKGRVASDEALLISLSCKDQEGQASVDANLYKSEEANLDSLTCNQAGTDGAFTIVACQGKIVTTYAGESRTWNLSDSNYKTVQEDGRWKMCGTASAGAATAAK